MEMSKFSPIVLGKMEWMSLSTHSVNSVMVETLKTGDVSETHYRDGRVHNVV